MANSMTRDLIIFLAASTIVICTLGLLLSSCGPAHSDNGARAVEIPSPVGVVCFAILDSMGNPTGGNCLWQK